MDGKNHDIQSLRDMLIARLDEQKVAENMDKMLATAPELPQSAGQIIVTALDWLESNVGELPDKILMRLGMFLTNYVLSNARNAGVVENPSSEMVQEVLKSAIQQWMQAHPDRVTTDPSQVEQFMQKAGGPVQGKPAGQPASPQPGGKPASQQPQRPKGLLAGG